MSGYRGGHHHVLRL